MSLPNCQKEFIEATIAFIFNLPGTEDELRTEIALILEAISTHTQGEYEAFSRVFQNPRMISRIDDYGELSIGGAREHMVEYVGDLVSNAANILELIRIKKLNSVILNYDESSDNFLKWYQQLVAESLGKKGNGVLPIISSMPKDNHSLMQLYLDGQKSNFYTFFYTQEKFSQKINSSSIPDDVGFLKKKSLGNILSSQILATQKVFKKKNIPFRTFMIKNRSEETLGGLFSFFMIETILIAKALKINPYDQPAVELIKKETKKILLNT